MREALLLKLGEIVLKGLNRSTFEDVLMKNIRKALSPCGEFSVLKAQSAVFINPTGKNADMDLAYKAMTKVFGVVSVSKAAVTEKDIEEIKVTALEYLRDELLLSKSFKVEGKRSDKRFPLKSPEISAIVGEYLCENIPGLMVDVHTPDTTVMVEVRDYGVYIHTAPAQGAGGMPAGTAGRAAVLISGGIDSPVAAWMMAKRGIRLYAIHFASPPYTSPRAEEKVYALLRRVAEYAGPIELFTVGFTEIQEKIHESCPEEYFTIIMRRYMMKVAARIARSHGCEALITGESLAQVASQTLQAIACTDIAAGIPVFRPLIGMDKEEIIRIARRIDTYDISILPYEDCCTVFTPRHPRTRPGYEAVCRADEGLSEAELINRALEKTKLLSIDTYA